MEEFFLDLGLSGRSGEFTLVKLSLAKHKTPRYGSQRSDLLLANNKI